nr:putative reverse transcriptase domain-containing protein [Tanacetum cinerariifolium]
MCQRRWIKLFSDYDCKIRYHPRKANVVAGEASKVENVLAKMLRGLDQQIEKKEDGGMYFMDRIWVPLVGDMRKMIIDKAETSNYHSSIRCAPFEASYERKSRSPALWAEIREGRLIGPELVQGTTDKVVLIKERLKVARDHQKSYADNRLKPLQFEVGDQVLLKVSHWKGVVSFGKKEKLAPSVHEKFHVSNLKKCLADANLQVPLEEIKVNKTLRFVEKPIEIMDRKVKKLKHSRIPIVKIRWNSKRDPEFTWEQKDFMKAKYLELFADRADENTS